MLKLIKIKFYYIAYDYDALILSNMFYTKLNYFKRRIQSSIHQNNLFSLIGLLESKKISYFIYDKGHKITKNFENNVYCELCENIENLYGENTLTILSNEIESIYYSKKESVTYKELLGIIKAPKEEIKRDDVVVKGKIITVEYTNGSIEKVIIMPIYYEEVPIRNPRDLSRVIYERRPICNYDITKGEFPETAPLSQAILGKKIGDKFSYKVKDKKFEGIIKKIELCNQYD